VGQNRVTFCPKRVTILPNFGLENFVSLIVSAKIFLYFGFFLKAIKAIRLEILPVNKMVGCLPQSAFFYVIELDASTTVRVANMIERIYHPSSSSCLVGIK